MPPEHETLPGECALTASSPLPEGSSCNVACKPGTMKVWIHEAGAIDKWQQADAKGLKSITLQL
jgi:hypothetical protein